MCYHNCLLHQHRTVLTHVLEDLVCCITSRQTGRFTGNCQRINKGLWMMFTNVYEEVMNESPYQSTWSVNPGYQLRDHLYQHQQYVNIHTKGKPHTGTQQKPTQTYLKPCINFNSTNSLHNGIIHFWPLTIVKPKCEQPQRVLQWTSVWQGNGTKEPLDCWHRELGDTQRVWL